MLIKLKYCNEIDAIIGTDYSTLLEIQSHYTYLIKDFYQRKKYTPKWKYWDGLVRLVRINKGDSFIPVGLIHNLILNFKKIYTIEMDDKLRNSLYQKINEEQYNNFIENLKLPFKPRDYQYDSIFKAIKYRKLTNISPTSSGKSLMIYLYIQWFLQHEQGKCLIIVPRIALVEQMFNDFKSYGYTGDGHLITGGVEKFTDKRLVISTWQSIHDIEDTNYFDKFGCVVLDECHSLKNQAEASSIINLIKKCTNSIYRMATTGTLDTKSELNQMQVEAMMGIIHQSTDMAELKENQQVTPAVINSYEIILGKATLDIINNLDYNKQVEFIEGVDPPNPLNLFIVDFVINLKGNTLILFNHIENGHGPFLYNKLLQYDTIHEGNIYYVDGCTSKEERKKLVHNFETKNGCIGVCSFGTFSTGINIKNLNNLVIAASTKSLFRTKQSVGRVLRLHESKEIANIYDFHYNTKYSSQHYMERKGYYQEDSHPVIENILTIDELIKTLSTKNLI